MGFCGWRCLLVLCALILALIALFAIVSSLIFDDTNYNHSDKDPRPNVGPYPGESPDNIFWFLQMTDIHISRYRGRPERLDHFRSFLTNDVDILKPALLLITGDLTDAKDRSRQGSEQYEDEWQWYRNAITDSNIEKKTTFLDIRGNHDAFNVPSMKHPKNMFTKYSVQGQKNPRSYSHLHKTSFGDYAFIGADSCPDPGLKRPFNFFGYLDASEWKRLDHLKTDARKANHTIWFGHYPSSVVISSSRRHFKSLLGDGLVYLCGHMHTLGGLAPKLYTIQKSGNLELELGDWLDNRLYRIVALDHDIMSFSDETFKKWPVVLITNPAHSSYLLPDREPTFRIKHSTHVRILVFSREPITSVKVFLNDEFAGEAKYSGSNLYVLPWNPEKFASDKSHSIKVQVFDDLGTLKTVEQPFSVDPKDVLALPKRFPNFVLQVDASSLLKVVFLITWIVATIPLICLHVYGRVLRGQICGPCAGIIRRWYHHYLVLCRSSSLFYPLMFMNFYIAFGPWFVGYVMDEYIGVAFTFGVYVMGHLLPMHTTLAYGTIQLITFNIPLSISLAAIADGVVTKAQTPQHTKKKFRIRSVFNLEYSIFYSILALQILKIVSHYLSYGTLSTIVSPLFLWQIIFAFVMKRRAMIVRRQLGGP